MRKEFIWMLASAALAVFAMHKGGVQLVVVLWFTACVIALAGMLKHRT